MGLTSNPSSAFTGVVIGLVSSFGSIVLIALVIFIFWVSGCASTGRIILDRLGRPGEYDDEQAFARDEAEALEVMDDMARQEYLRAKGTFKLCSRYMGIDPANIYRNSLGYRKPSRVNAN
jgi:hypothetical protein